MTELNNELTLQFSTTDAWQSAVIRRMCHSPFSHVDVVFSNGLFGASDNPTVPVIAGNVNGVALRSFDYQPFHNKHIAKVKTDKARQIIARLSTQLGKGFDDTALYDFLDDTVDRNWRQPTKWFCSELVLWALESEGFFPYELIVPKNRVTPADLLLILNQWIDAKDFWSNG